MSSIAKQALLEAAEIALFDSLLSPRPGGRKPGEMFKSLPRDLKEKLKDLKSEDAQNFLRLIKELDSERDDELERESLLGEDGLRRKTMIERKYKQIKNRSLLGGELI